MLVHSNQTWFHFILLLDTSRRHSVLGNPLAAAGCIRIWLTEFDKRLVQFYFYTACYSFFIARSPTDPAIHAPVWEVNCVLIYIRLYVPLPSGPATFALLVFCQRYALLVEPFPWAAFRHNSLVDRINSSAEFTSLFEVSHLQLHLPDTASVFGGRFVYTSAIHPPLLSHQS